MDDISSSADFSTRWMNFFIVAGVVILASLAALGLAFIVGKRRKRKRRHRHRSRVTLAETGGLPPARRSDNPTPPQP
jgi:membrane protein DedA with SNARE-associated domain